MFLPFIMWAERALKFRYLNPVEQSLQRAANGAALVIIPPLLLFGVLGADGISTRIRKFLDDNKEIQSIKSNIETDTAWMTGPMRHDMQVMGGTDFRALKDRCTTLYVILPTSEMVNKAPYLRLLLSTVLRHLYRYDGLPVTLLVDEAFVLGHLTELENVC